MSRNPEPVVPATGSLLFVRLASTLMLRARVYREIACDRLATAQAAAVVCLAALAQGVPLVDDLGLLGWPIKLISAALVWLSFAAVAYLIAHLAGRPSRYICLLRTLGFAEAPGILNLIAHFAHPSFAIFVRYGLWLWVLAGTLVGIRAATNAEPARALAIALPSFVLRVILGFLVFLFWWRLHELIQHSS